MKKLFTRGTAALALTAATALLLSGCGASADAGGSESADGGKGAIAMGFAGMDITIWNDQLTFMEPIIEEAGYEFLTSDPQWDVQKQVSDWEAWIQRGDVKAIMGFPVQSDAMVPVTAKATAEGIPVLGYATRWDGTVAGTIIDSYEDGYLVGTVAAEWITENLADEDEVPVALVADKTSDLGKGRTEGIAAAITELAPNAKIYELPGISREEGNSVAKSHLVAVPDTKIWVGTSNDNTAGAYQALLDSGVAKDDESYYVGATDATNETLDVIKIPNSIWRGGFILPAKELAESNADLLLRAAAGEEVEDNVITSTRVTAENADEFYVN
ncbi:sugar ABC transporter substrate-binding protein [Leucobacter rhizosphaerae]|uniref:Sugar ABC transporter substrate-binding protein n=1 Tax=Leucobacter rhizosphaerae TaxID=2932245 RepID=A0ABY4FTW8_9MICO|nr:sugar ABC transporter substrate-binding protein [Leucobacter rhizosphaerae]UOQ59741.1 sugar ABC transporter substrate-binding protein [Leucobacter rhizosphaerae]